MDIHRYQKQDLQAAINLMNIHIVKLTKAVEQNSYPDACSALRAMETECNHASEVAVSLSLNSHLNEQRR